MVTKTRTMRKMQESIKSILNDEKILYEIFDTMVEIGQMDDERLSEVRKITGIPTLYHSEIVTLNKDEIMSDPYLKNINIPNASSNNFHLVQRRLRPRLVTKYGFKTRDLNTMCKSNSYFRCEERLRFPGLVEGDSKTCWMSVEPFEINSFQPFINNATGDVLLIGCGLGYAAYMLSEKDDVRSVTVVDNNEDVLSLFNTHILPQFKNKDKVHTVASDGLEYLKSNDLTVFDNINVDIWYDTVDMIYPYLRCLEIEKANPTVNFSYWLEEELKQSIQENLLIAISGFKSDGLLANKIGEDIVKDTPIKTYEDFYNLMNIKDIRSFLYNWYVNNLDIVENYEPIDMRRINDSKEAYKQVIEGKNLPKVYSKK